MPFAHTSIISRSHHRVKLVLSDGLYFSLPKPFSLFLLHISEKPTAVYDYLMLQLCRSTCYIS